MTKIAIIGSGANAAAAHFSLIENGINRDKITIYSHDKVNFANMQEESSSLLKFNKSIIQGDSKLGVKSQLKHGIAGSGEFGGWTNYWGATTFKWPTSVTENREIFEFSPSKFYGNIEKMMQSHIKIIRVKFPKYSNRLIEKLENLHVENENIFISNSSLAIENYSPKQSDGCNNCGQCLSGCPVGHIWSASKYFKSIHFISSSVLRIYKESNSYRFDYIDQNGLTKSSPNYEFIILACGSIQTARLLINSEIADRAEISQNDMELVPFVLRGLPKIGGYERISLSEAFIWTEGLNDFFMQCYGMNSQILKKAFNSKILQDLCKIKPISEILDRVGIAMVFKNSTLSNSIDVSKDSNGTCTISEIKSSESVSKIGKQKINGLTMIKFLKRRAHTGESFHYGASKFFKNSENLNLDYSRGEFSNLPNLIIVDSSSLPILPSYPVTFTSMANAYGIIKRKFG